MPPPKHFESGDIVEFDMNEPGNALTERFAQQGPFEILGGDGMSNYCNYCYRVRRLDGKPILDMENDPVSHESFFSWRFKKHAFLDAARKAIKDA